jgi:hypothetical protein
MAALQLNPPNDLVAIVALFACTSVVEKRIKLAIATMTSAPALSLAL